MRWEECGYSIVSGKVYDSKQLLAPVHLMAKSNVELATSNSWHLCMSKMKRMVSFQISYGVNLVRLQNIVSRQDTIS